MIEKETLMLLFRYSNYKKFKFIEEHRKIIQNYGYTWMMKVGKKTSSSKIEKIIDNGGYMVLKSPIAEGNLFYIAKIEEFSENLPDDTKHMPEYYSKLVDDDDFWGLPTQFFKLVELIPLDEEYAATLRLEKNKNNILDVINTTRTAVMFIENEKAIDISI